MTLAELIREEIRKENPLGPIMDKLVKAVHDGIREHGDFLVLCNGNIEKSHVEDWGSVYISKKDESAFVDWCYENGLHMRDSYNISGRRAGFVLSI